MTKSKIPVFIPDRISALSEMRNLLIIFATSLSLVGGLELLPADELGVINAGAPPFNADPTGTKDATAALQAAIDEGGRTNKTVYIPLGTYRITDTLNCTQPDDGGSWFPPLRVPDHVIVGESSPEGSRPTLWLPSATPGFTNATNGKFVVFFWHASLTGHFNEPMDNINQVLQGIDVRIDPGNPGAVGIRHQGAQGSSIQDVTVWAHDALVGILGAAGGGGAHINVKVVGGRFGMDLRLAQPAPTVVGVTLINQSCTALVYHGRGPLTLVGVHIEQSAQLALPGSPGVVCGGTDKSLFTGSCSLPVVPHPGWEGIPTVGGSLSLVDVSILRTGLQPKTPVFEMPAISFNRSVYARNTFIRGFTTVALGTVRWPETGNSIVSAPANNSWFRIDEMAIAVIPPRLEINSTKYQFLSPAYIDNQRMNVAKPWLSLQLQTQSPPSNLVTQHIWNEATFPSFQSPSAVNARTICGAVGDGVTDDWQALQKCVDEHDLVVLPKGFYRISRTLLLSRPNGALVGVGRTASVLMPTSSGFGSMPLLSILGENTTLFQFSYVTFWHQPDAWLLEWNGAGGMWRQSHGYRMCDLLAWQASTGEWKRSCAGYPSNLVKLSARPMTIITGGGRFYCFFVETFNGQAPQFRHILVNHSTSGLYMYQVDPQHTFGEAEMEIVDSNNVKLFGMQSEGNFCILWVRRSSDILYTGFGGFGAAFPLNHTWTPGEPAYQPGYSTCTPSLFRVENSSDVTLANLWGDFRVDNKSFAGCCGRGVDPRWWSMTLWTSLDTDRGTHCKGIGNTSLPLDRPVVMKI
eukprot:m.15726 g.15726  ORF g.15726 m.15726 type:complete len:804 (+) comp5475_c0_seq1:175-2586(+)